ncbi:Asp-tRNA(Asn)/Glu-tRNA(Gln) amidotransferase subunit GatC [Spiroplasma cantharicola]|uniref:Aspartyl/glutamyl-tRNA(Asn/Gln) amidotransferase subunit C n=1 Tax=Spiroplasma cantharicola TaxID=362837 RepID=A0A0M4K0M9_9MOLU|nr:Asp-tRNA(Asn)/Glu-tRNA(Gln) amidotransferase subunit GatC [Spiroplasma cantharicola]ALD66025.1 glutamyl-tRNA(Gln) amidotransferase subunit C [Spiroplasma cantharicola]
MTINLELLKELQEDAMLDLSEKELQNILKYENIILKKFEKVLLVNTDNVEEMHYPFDITTNKLREDQEVKTLPKDEILKNAPSVHDDFITIVKVVK